MPDLRAWLVAQGLVSYDSAAEIVPTFLAGGRSNVSYRLTCSEMDVVLRRPPLGNIMPTAHDMTREHRVLSGLGRVQFPVPQALTLCENESVLGVPFMLMSFVEGRTIADSSDAQTLSATSTAAMSHALIDTLAQLHQIDPDHAGLADLGKPLGYLDRQVRRWSQQWQLTKTRDLPHMDTLEKKLEELVAALPNDLPTSIVHGDFRIDNVIWHTHRDDIAAVLDWEMATLGDPISDLAISLVYWSEPADTLRGQIPVAEHITESPGFWSRADLIERYASRTGFDVGHLDTCVALACFKLAVIMESIHKRNLDGQQLGAASNDRGRMGVATAALARMGCRTIEIGALAALGE
jgi:aminoglycoside phosphotransferase (APT) family kinase protein